MLPASRHTAWGWAFGWNAVPGDRSKRRADRLRKTGIACVRSSDVFDNVCVRDMFDV